MAYNLSGLCGHCRGIQFNEPEHEKILSKTFNDGEKAYKPNQSRSAVLEIPYERIDTLPALPSMLSNSESGCVFCRLLWNLILRRQSRSACLAKTGIITTRAWYEWFRGLQFLHISIEIQNTALAEDFYLRVHTDDGEYTGCLHGGDTWISQMTSQKIAHVGLTSNGRTLRPESSQVKEFRG